MVSDLPHMCLTYTTRLGYASLHASDETVGTTGKTRIVVETHKKLYSRVELMFMCKQAMPVPLVLLIYFLFLGRREASEAIQVKAPP
jgi:hypothetical protein